MPKILIDILLLGIPAIVRAVRHKRCKREEQELQRRAAILAAKLAKKAIDEAKK